METLTVRESRDILYILVEQYKTTGSDTVTFHIDNRDIHAMERAIKVMDAVEVLRE